MTTTASMSPSRAQDWQTRLSSIVAMMREMSRQTDAQSMFRAFSARIRGLMPVDASVSLSRRGLEAPHYRITRSSHWREEVNPWQQKDKLPLLSSGLLGELLYGDEPRIIDDLRVAHDDPAAEYLAGQRSLVAIPLYDGGVATNMVVLMRQQPGAFDPEEFPERVWISNLFGRATQTLVLAEELQQAQAAVNNELKVIADIQRSLLPAQLPRVPTLDLAVYYQTSQQAGGDYYDILPLPDGRWGLLIADVSGHGTPAAVLMAITHSIVHTLPVPATEPRRVFEYLNEHLTARYTAVNGAFVTAFYGVYDPATRTLVYSSAGHNPPRLKRCDDGTMASLDRAQGLPLGILENAAYDEATHHLRPGDQIVFYTDGITEAHNASGEMFGVERLDGVLEACRPAAEALIQAVLEAVDAFSAGRPPDDDRTMLIAKIT